jgi:hypothetical protein
LDGSSYLHYFASREDKEICELLMLYGADPYFKTIDYGKYTAIDVWPDLEELVRSPQKRVAEIGSIARGTGARYYDVEFFCCTPL